MTNNRVYTVYDKYGRAFPVSWLNPTETYYTRPIQEFPVIQGCLVVEGTFGLARVFLN